MKKILTLTIVVLAIVLTLASCRKTPENSATQHANPNVPSVHVHIEEIIPSVDSTCIQQGLTEGKKCSVCGEILVKQEVLPLVAHTEEIIPSVESSCTQEGLTEGKKCSVCDEILVDQHKISVLTHTYDDKYDETCNVCGHRRDVECAHMEIEKIKGRDATCLEIGYTDGEKCKMCGEIIKPQTVISVIDCIAGEWIIDKEATKDEDGLMHNMCIMCGQKVSESIIYALGSEGLAFHLNKDNQSYSVSIGYCIDTNIVIPKQFNGKPVTEIINKGFYQQSSIESVIIPDSVTRIGVSAFRECYNLKSIIIPDSVTIICDGAFRGCRNLTYVKLSNSLTIIEVRAFSLCWSLKDITIPDSVTSIDSGAFEECNSITSITIPALITNFNGLIFENCKSLTSINVDNNNPHYMSIDGILYSKDGKTVVAYPQGRQETSFSIPDGVEIIGMGAFAYSNLVNVYLPDSISIIGNCAFEYSKLTNLTIPKSVISIEVGAFRNCVSLKSINIPDSVTSIGINAFTNCKSLSSITIPNSVTSIGDSAFSLCTSLTSIEIPYSVTNMGECVFQGCERLNSVIISKNVKITNGMFYECYRLKSITFEGTIEEWNTTEKGRNWDVDTGTYTVYCTDGEIAQDGTITYYEN